MNRKLMLRRTDWDNVIQYVTQKFINLMSGLKLYPPVKEVTGSCA